MNYDIAALIVGIGGGEREYKIDDIAYTVSSNFEPFQSTSTYKDRLARTLVSDFAPLTVVDTENKIAYEYVCSAAGEEVNHAVEKEN